MKIKLMYLACALSLIIATSCGANSKKSTTVVITSYSIHYTKLYDLILNFGSELHELSTSTVSAMSDIFFIIMIMFLPANIVLLKISQSILRSSSLFERKKTVME